VSAVPVTNNTWSSLGEENEGYLGYIFTVMVRYAIVLPLEARAAIFPNFSSPIYL